MSLQLRVASHSEVGLVRKNNQDSGYASPRLLVVADGMGGAAAGDLASAVAIETIRSIDAAEPTTAEDDDNPPSGSAMLDRLTEAIHRANTRIAEMIEADYALEGMGTTVTGALFDGIQFGLAHIGDSRAYLLRNGRLERLTHDHSWVQSLIDDGKLSEAEAAVHPHRSLLLKVLNGQPANDPDLTVVNVQPGDRVLFCSDGICGLVEDPEIADALRLPDLQQAMTRLVDLALAEGGIDNITAILADVIEGEGSTDVAVLGAAAERDAAKAAPTPAEDTVVRAPAGSADGSATAESLADELEPEDEARYDPRVPRKRRVLRPLAIALVVLLVVGAGLGAGYAWTRSQYFVGASGGQVAIYQGLPDGLPGIPLSRVYEVQPLALSALPPYYQTQVTSGIEVSSLDAARQTVAELTATAERCAAQQPTPEPSPTPTSNPSASRAPPSSSTPVKPTPSRPSATAAATSSKPTPSPSRRYASPSSTTPGPGSDC